MFSKFPFLSRVFAFVILPLIILSLLLLFLLSLSLPISKGDVDVIGLKNNALINYDKQGVPHISAATDADVYFSLGFAHAQNRLWQMEMNRRTATGRLCEILGRGGLPSDVYMRILGLNQNAKRMWDHLPDTERAVLTQYVKGVNEGIAQLRVLPLEYYLTGFTPEPWTEIDSLLWIQLMSVQLSGNMAAELQRSLLFQSFGIDKTNQLMSEVDAQSLMQMADASVIPEEYRTPKAFVGSNSWVVSGKNSASGKPILANDPHLVNSLPSVFYLATLKGDKLNVTGATFPGLPFVVIGKNSHIAWGLTNMMADTQDVFLEKINPANAHQYEFDGRYRDMDVSIEKINIKKEPLQKKVEPYVLEVRRTHHGPLLSDLVGPHKYYAYSLRWTGDDDMGGTFKSFLALNYANNWQEFNNSLADFVTPIHNFMYADDEGHIGSVAPGAYPIRKGTGAMPRKGWLSENDWNGWIPTDKWPRQLDPESGVIIAANNNILPKDYPYYITSDWAPDYRTKRIQQLLTEKLAATNNKLTMTDFADIQLDITNPAATSLLSYFIALNPTTDAERKAIDMLRSWSGAMDLNSAEAVLFATWIAHFNRLLIDDDATKLSRSTGGEAALEQMAAQDNVVFLEKVLSNNDPQGWCDYISTPAVETCNQLLLVALDHALNELTKKLGSDMNHWQWKNVHVAHFPHFPFAERKYSPDFPAIGDSGFAFLFHRSIASAGGSNSINVAPFSLAENNRFSQFVGPSYRQIIDLGQPGIEQFSVSTGQSGNLLSPHYDDWIGNHQRGHYLTIEGLNASQSIKLIPKNGASGE